MFGIKEKSGIIYRWSGNEEQGLVEMSRENVAGHVEVLFEKKQSGKTRLDVNWSAIGSVCVEEAKQFRAMLDEGIRIGETIALFYTRPHR